MILHSVTPIWAMQQMMAEQSEQPITVLLSETAALQGYKTDSFWWNASFPPTRTIFCGRSFPRENR